MTHPIVVATLQASGLAAIANILAQGILAYKSTGVIQPFTLNWFELLRFIILTVVTAPPNYKWQQFLERSFPAYGPQASNSLPLTNQDSTQANEKREQPTGHGEAPAKPRLSIRNTIAKWFIDCITMGALMNTSAFLIIMSFLKGQNLPQIGNTLQKELFPIILASYKIWPIASIISFSCVPVERRIVFLSFVGMCWGIYMSIVAARV